MANRWSILLPFAALVLVVAAAAFIMLTVALDSRDAAPRSDSADASDPTPGPSVAARIAGDVCQGVLSRPGPGEPRVFSSHYTTIDEQNGIAIVASDGVDDDAVDEAKKTIERVFRNNDLEDYLVEDGAYVIITRGAESLIDLPEFSCLEKDSPASAELVSHACGVADSADYPVIAVNERDLIGDRRGPCSGLNILYHELGHLVQGWSLDHIDYLDVKVLYQRALDTGLYRREYAATNPNEYFAEATQAYFLSQDRGGDKDRDWLKKYDPDLYAVIARVYGD